MRGIPKLIFEYCFCYRELPFHVIFPSEILVEWFEYRKFNNFHFSRFFSQEISAPIAAVSRVPELLVEWKTPTNHLLKLSSFFSCSKNWLSSWYFPHQHRINEIFPSMPVSFNELHVVVKQNDLEVEIPDCGQFVHGL